MKRTLAQLEDSNVQYCIFKSTDHTLAGLKGTTDLDLLIYEQDISLALDIFRQADFKDTYPGFSTHNPYRYGLIAYCDYYKSQVYIDIMTRVVIGVNRFRQYRCLSSACSIIQNSVRCKFDIFSISPLDELVWLHYRLVAKTRSSFPRLDYLFYRSLINKSFSSENENLIKGALPNINGSAISDYLLNYKYFNFDRYKRTRDFLEQQSKPLIHSNFNRICKELYALLQKIERSLIGYHYPFLFLKRKTLSKGLLIFLVGIDGSGKSTLSKQLHKELSWKLDSYRIYLGAGDGLGSLLRRFFTKLSSSQLFTKSLTIYSSKSNMLDKHPSLSSYSANTTGFLKLIARVIWATVICREKNRKYKFLCRLISKNNIVIADRFPNLNPSGAYDSPQLSAYINASNLFLHKIASWEYSVYKKFAELPIDLCIKLDASMDLVNSRSEFFTYSTFNSRIKSMNVALNTLNIKQCFSLDASNEVKYLTDASLARVFSLNG